MKIKNIFKRSEKTVAKAKIQKLEKNQLEKVVGGADIEVVDVASRYRPGNSKPIQL